MNLHWLLRSGVSQLAAFSLVGGVLKIVTLTLEGSLDVIPIMGTRPRSTMLKKQLFKRVCIRTTPSIVLPLRKQGRRPVGVFTVNLKESEQLKSKLSQGTYS